MAPKKHSSTNTSGLRVGFGLSMPGSGAGSGSVCPACPIWVWSGLRVEGLSVGLFACLFLFFSGSGGPGLDLAVGLVTYIARTRPQCPSYNVIRPSPACDKNIPDALIQRLPSKVRCSAARHKRRNLSACVLLV